MSPLMLVLLIVLLVIVIGGLPHWGYSRGWGLGYAPSGIVGVLLIVLVVLLIMGRL